MAAFPTKVALACRASHNTRQASGLANLYPLPPPVTTMTTYQRNIEIANLIASGAHTLDEVGSRYGLTRQRVHQIVTHFGVSTRTRGPHRRHPLLDPNAIARALDLYGHGMPINHIAQTLGLNAQALRTHLVKIGVHEPQARRPWSEEDTAFLLAHYKVPGWPAWAIAEALGVHETTVRDKARQHGLGRVRLSGSARRDRQDQIAALRRRHMTFAAIAHQLGVPEGTVAAEYYRWKKRQERTAREQEVQRA